MLGGEGGEGIKNLNIQWGEPNFKGNACDQLICNRRGSRGI